MMHAGVKIYRTSYLLQYSMAEYLCALCSSFAAKSLKALIRHLGLVHANEAGFHVRCQVEDCPRTYKKFLSYKKHMYSKHRDILGCSSYCIDEQSSTDYFPVANSVEDDAETPEMGLTSNVSSRREVMLFVLKAKHIHHIPQSSLCEVMNDFTSLLEQSAHSLHSRVAEILGNVDPALRNRIDEVFSLQDPFCGMTTEHMQNCFLKEAFHYVVRLYSNCKW